MLNVNLISKKIAEINSLIVQVDRLDGRERSELIKNILSPLINECCDLVKGKEKELLSTENIVQALSQCNFTDSELYKVVGISFDSLDFWASIIYKAKQEGNKAGFLSGKIAEINSLIVQVDRLDGRERSELVKNILSPLINECCDFIKGREKELLSTENVVQVLSECNFNASEAYKVIGTSFNNLDYWAQIIKITKQAESSKSTFYLIDDVLYLLPNNACINDIKTRNILLVGENDFSFAYSYALTHRDKSRNLIASEYQLKDINDAVLYLLSQGVIIAYGMDATKLHEYSHLGIGSFQRVQFNCPYDIRDSTPEGSIQKTHTKKLLHGFMASAKELLHLNGRLHVSIQQPKDPEPYKWGKKEYQNALCLPESACLHQFKLVRVMGNIQDRYANKVQKLLQDEEVKVAYAPYLGQGEKLRINQFIFKQEKQYYVEVLDYLEYTTDNETDSEDESKSRNLRPSPSL